MNGAIKLTLQLLAPVLSAVAGVWFLSAQNADIRNSANSAVKLAYEVRGDLKELSEKFSRADGASQANAKLIETNSRRLDVFQPIVFDLANKVPAIQRDVDWLTKAAQQRK